MKEEKTFLVKTKSIYTYTIGALLNKVQKISITEIFFPHLT